MNFPHGVTVTVQRATQDRFGDRTYADHHDVAGCAVSPRSGDGRSASSEAGENRTTVIVGLTLYCPPDADILATDRVVLPDGAYQVIGQPGRWASPFTGWAPGTEVALERVVG